jgi:hypothetical protein
MDRLTTHVCRLRAARSRLSAAPCSRELRDPSFEGPRSSRRRSRLRSEHGQASVEFAIAALLLCLVIIAIFHFGKVMNYWLDLNHVASEGARKAAVNTLDTDVLRSRLETIELRDGGTTSIPNPATIAVCFPDGTSAVGDPVEVQVAADYALPFIGATITLRGSATMRMEQAADFSAVGTCA